jgi:hypothetical protein
MNQLVVSVGVNQHTSSEELMMVIISLTRTENFTKRVLALLQQEKEAFVYQFFRSLAKKGPVFKTPNP